MKHNIILNMVGHMKSDNITTSVAETTYKNLQEVANKFAKVYKYDIDMLKQLVKLKKIILFIKMAQKKDLHQFAVKLDHPRELYTLALVLMIYNPGKEEDYKEFLSRYQYIWRSYNKKFKNYDAQINRINNEFLNPSWIEVFKILPKMDDSDLEYSEGNIEMLFQDFDYPLRDNQLAVHVFGSVCVYEDIFKEYEIYDKTALDYGSVIAYHMKTYKFAHEIYRKLMNRYFLDESLRYLLKPEDILKQFDKLCKGYSGPTEFRDPLFRTHFKNFALPIYEWLLDNDLQN